MCDTFVFALVLFFAVDDLQRAFKLIVNKQNINWTWLIPSVTWRLMQDRHSWSRLSSQCDYKLLLRVGDGGLSPDFKLDTCDLKLFGVLTGFLSWLEHYLRHRLQFRIELTFNFFIFFLQSPFWTCCWDGKLRRLGFVISFVSDLMGNLAWNLARVMQSSCVMSRPKWKIDWN